MLDMRMPVLLVMMVLALGCAKQESAVPTSDTAAAASRSSGVAEPAPGRKVIVITMITDERGNYFEAASNDDDDAGERSIENAGAAVPQPVIEAKRGDVLRFTLGVGVHNVHFLPDSNPGTVGLPPASDMLQLPGQTFDVPVTFPRGQYYFQCDPHVAVGMKGHVRVEE